TGGTYYIAISAGGSGDWQSKTGNYRIDLDDLGVVTSDTIPNDTSSTSSISVGGYRTGTIDQYDMDGNSVDKDYYKVTLTAGHRYQFTADGTSGNLDKVAIRVYNSSGSSVTSIADSANPTLDYTPSTGGTYYIAISAGGSGDWQSKTGNYRIDLDDLGIVTSDTIPNDTSSTSSISVGGTVFGEIQQDDVSGYYIDKDYYKVVLTAGQSYTFSANANQSTTDTLDQVFMRLRDADGNSITSSASAEGATPSFTYEAAGSGSQTYYLAISAGGDGLWWDKTGGFSLDLTANGTVTVANQTPYAQGSSKTVAPGESVALTDLFSYGDRDGLSDIVSFAVQDRTFDGGHLTFNGMEMAANTVFERPISEINKWAFVAGDTGSDTIGFNAIDSQNAFNNSAIATVAVQTTTTPVLQSASELFAAAGGKMTAMAEFAIAAYIKTEGDVADGLLADGWKIPTTISPLNEDGYYINGNASAFVSESGDGNSLVIAFTGTNEGLDFLDYPALALHYENYNLLFNEINFDNYTNIYVSGHSLGGAMAQAFMVDPPDKLSSLLNPPKVDAVAFANPGYGNSLFSRMDNLVNISIRGDVVAELGVDSVIAGDRFWVDPTEYSSPSSQNPTARHEKYLYYAVAKYIDGSSEKNVIANQIENGSDDFREVPLYLTGTLENGFRAMTPFGANFTPLEAFLLEPPSAVSSLSALKVFEGIGIYREILATSNRFIVYTSDTVATTLEIIADATDVAVSAVVGGTKYLVNKSSSFASLLLKAGDAAFEAIIKPLDGTDIEQNTVYFEGGLSDDVLRGGAADRHLVAEGGAGDDLLTGGLMGDTLKGDAGNDIIRGGAGDDKIYGGIDYDTLYGGDGNDRVWGGNGRDKAYLGRGDDVFFDNAQNGKNGWDTVYGGDGKDIIKGGGGNDKFYGEAGNDVIRGGIGNDKIYGGTDYDTLYGGAGNDRVWGGNGRDKAYLGKGDDVFFDNGQKGKNGGDTVYGGDGKDTINGGGGNDKFYGEAGEDLIRGGSGNDKINGGTNSDTLYGGDGNDRLIGGAGDDTLIGGAGDDTLIGGAGEDTLIGGKGYDTASYKDASSGVIVYLNGLSDRNTGEAAGDSYASIENLVGSRFDDELWGVWGGGSRLEGGDGDDKMFGFGGDNTFIGGKGADYAGGSKNGIDTLSYETAQEKVLVDLQKSFLNTGDAKGDYYFSIDILKGSDFNDTLTSSRSGNRIEGGNGSDQLFGREGVDTLFGGNGDDTLNGGDGNDTLNGGFGRDTFVFATGGGRDVIEDFNRGNDSIQLEGFGMNRAQALNAAAQGGADVVIDLGGGDIITLLNTDLASLTRSDFDII
ncbi:MAG: hypothetical protein COC12_06200, partial [Rhodobacteraceae bacterium]